MKDPIYSPTRGFDINISDSVGSMKRQHYHSTYEFFLVIEGSKEFFINGGRYLLKKGSMFVIEPFVLHMTTASCQGCKRYIIDLSPDALAPVLTAAERKWIFDRITTSVMTFTDEEFSHIYALFKDAHRYRNAKDPVSGKLALMTLSLLTDTVRRRSGDGIRIDAPKTGEGPMSEALRYINLNYTDPLTLDEICAIAHMSRSNFCLLFKKITGDTFVNHINALRVSQAHRLLTTTSLPVVKIAAAVGFSSADYLARAFKKIHGIPPSKLRDQQHETSGNAETDMQH